MAEGYDPRAKRVLESATVNGATVVPGDRVRYAGSSPCFAGRSGVLTKIRRQWSSPRGQSRAGFGRGLGRYVITVEVLWDPAPVNGPYAHPQGCMLDEIVKD